MSNRTMSLSVAQLKSALSIRKQIETLETEFAQILGRDISTTPIKNGRRKMSASTRAKIAAAQQARWAKVKETPEKPKRRMSAAGRAAMSVAAKARWKKAKAARKSRL